MNCKQLVSISARPILDCRVSDTGVFLDSPRNARAAARSTNERHRYPIRSRTLTGGTSMYSQFGCSLPAPDQ